MKERDNITTKVRTKEPSHSSPLYMIPYWPADRHFSASCTTVIETMLYFSDTFE